MTPHHLHALAAAWSLQAARQRLHQLATDEAATDNGGLLDAAPLLHSPLWGTRHGVGGHGDPVTATLTADRPEVRVTTWADRLQRLDGKLAWLARQLPTTPDTDADPLARIIAATPRLQPGTARIVGQHLADEEQWVREAIGQPRPMEPLTGVDCPACGQRALYVQTAGPEQAWTVVCATGCRCAGVGVDGRGCPCGMPGVAHIWPRAVVLGAVAGAAPTRTR